MWSVHDTVKYDLFLYTDDSCLGCQRKDINEIQNQLNEDFSSICDCFLDNKLLYILVRIRQIQYFLLLNLKGKFLKTPHKIWGYTNQATF